MTYTVMRAVRAVRRLLLALTATSLVVAAPALAQDPIPPPKHSAVDANGVDLISGAMSVTSGLNSIGPDSPGGLAASKTLRAGNSISSMFSYVKLMGSAEVQETTLVAFMGQSQVFDGTPDIGPAFNEGNTLDKDATHIRYTLADGTVARFRLVHINYNHPLPVWGVLQSVTYPSGEVLTFTYDVPSITATWMQVESSLGYAIVGTGGMHEWNAGAAANLTQGGCTGSTCSGPTFASQEALGRAQTKSVSGMTVTINNPAGGTPKTYTVYADSTYPNGLVTSVTDGAGTWTYSYGQEYDQPSRPNEFINVVTVTDPLGNKRTVRSRNSTQNILSDKVGIKPDGTGGDITTFQYTSDATVAGFGALNGITAPEGNRVRYVYDGQFNVIEKWADPKPGSGQTATVMKASYNMTLCASIRVCNRPDWIKDERDKQTDFTYDPAHGGVLTMTKPAADNNIRPQTRFTYGQFTARYIKNGVLTAAPSVWRLTQASTCALQATCAGTPDETITSYAYEPSNVANNVRLLSTTTRAGDNSLSATVGNTYDARGDVITVDGPLAGTTDTTRTYYDASRWKTGIIGPDPDGAGALLNRATRTTYAADGQATSVESGTATNQSDTGMSTFVALQQAVPAYNTQRRKVSDTLVVGGAAQTVTQYGYDTAARLICQTVRMNPAAFASAPGACALGTQGVDGPDRITYSEYDAANRVTKVTSGYGTSGAYAPRVEVRNYYFPNGTKQFVVDGAGNTTQYGYDGFDRLTTTYYSVAAVGTGAVNGADYDLYSYDPAGNRTGWRRRDGTQISYTFDALNRVTYRDGVGIKGWYYYDNLDRPTFTYSGNAAERIIANYYDPLGRPTATYDWRDGAWRRSTYEWHDLAGRRTALQWADDFYVNYNRDVTGSVTAIYENGTLVIGAYAYDNLGRRTYDWGGPGAPLVGHSYGYDAASRLASLGHDVPGPDKDQAWTFTYNAASQVKTRTASNSLYEWAGIQTTKSYTVNGLNQYLTVGGATLSHTLRGNLKSDGSRTYCYDLLNNLSGLWNGAVTCSIPSPPPSPVMTLSYDPVGRLDTTVGAATTRLVYSGPDLIEETSAANATLRRYVPGPGTDEPLAWYEGAGTGDRRWLSKDPQGSVVSVTTNAGAVTLNTYDEYGIPAAGNQGRYQYTGQTWIPELGLYHYKARAYSPTLGRFLQTDPTGYDDGLNWYAYVGNDPLNGSDPTGMFCECMSSVTYSGDAFAGEKVPSGGGSGYSDKSLSRDLETQKRDFAKSQEENMPEVNRQLLIGGGTIIAVGVSGGTVGGLVSTSGVFSTVPAGLEVLTGRAAGAQLTRLAVPGVPGGFTTSTFGRSLVQWGNGVPGALARAEVTTGRSVAAMREQGLTRFMTRQWRDFYASQVGRRGGEVAASRAELLKKILKLW